MTTPSVSRSLLLLIPLIFPAAPFYLPTARRPPIGPSQRIPPVPRSRPQRPGCSHRSPPLSGATQVTTTTGPLGASDKPFIHPGIYYNAEDLDFMRRKLAAQAEPWYSAWQQCKPAARDDTWVPHPKASWDATQDFYQAGDPVVAHKEALQWALTGNPANAAKAIEIINAWSATMQNIVTHKMPQEKLASGINGNQWANAAELLCYGGLNGQSSGWAQPDIQRCKQMLGMFYNVTQDFMPGYNGNWDAIMMDSMACMGVFLDDHAMFDRAITHYLQGEKPNGGLDNYVYPSGQCQEDYRDQGHVQWGLGGLVATCEVAWKQGIDLYGADNNRLMLGLEYTAKYNLGNDVPYQGAGVISAKGRGGFAPIWETPYQHYVYDKGLEMPYTKQIVFGTHVSVGGRNKGAPGSYRPEGDYAAGISWGTFTMFRGPQGSK